MNIYCFPYAGGSSFMYSELRKKLSGSHKIIPMEYPGHGVRMGEELIDSPDQIIDDMFNQICMKDNGAPFALLGYSLGSKLLFLLYDKYRDNAIFRRLKAVFFCASALLEKEKGIDYSALNDDELMDYVLNLGGSKIESEEDYENYRLFLPIIRNDFILYEKAKERIMNEEYRLIDKNTYILYSSDEDNIDSYDKFCVEPPEYGYFSDGHFFIHSHCDEMAVFINDRINEIKKISAVNQR